MRNLNKTKLFLLFFMMVFFPCSIFGQRFKIDKILRSKEVQIGNKIYVEGQRLEGNASINWNYGDVVYVKLIDTEKSVFLELTYKKLQRTGSQNVRIVDMKYRGADDEYYVIYEGKREMVPSIVPKAGARYTLHIQEVEGRSKTNINDKDIPVSDGKIYLENYLFDGVIGVMSCQILEELPDGSMKVVSFVIETL